MSQDTHRTAILATYLYVDRWSEGSIDDALEFFNSLSVDEQNTVRSLLVQLEAYPPESSDAYRKTLQDDKLHFNVGTSRDRTFVAVQFERPVSYIEFTKERAAVFAKLLVEKADLLEPLH